MVERNHTIGAVVLVLAVFVIAHATMSTMTGATILNESPTNFEDGTLDPEDKVEIIDIPDEKQIEFVNLEIEEDVVRIVDIPIDYSCMDECYPKGNMCDGDGLRSCGDFDDDPCLEYMETQCTFGCDEDACRTKPEEQPLSQDQIRNMPHLELASGQECIGEPIAAVQWNPHGSLCRRGTYDSANRGFITPMHCCRRYFTQTSCISNLGPIKDQYHGLPLKYLEIECWR